MPHDEEIPWEAIPEELVVPFTFEEVASWDKIEDVDCPMPDCPGVHDSVRRRNPDPDAKITQVRTLENDQNAIEAGLPPCVYGYIFTYPENETYLVKVKTCCHLHMIPILHRADDLAEPVSH
jgi:hypothetical protein